MRFAKLALPLLFTSLALGCTEGKPEALLTTRADAETAAGADPTTAADEPAGDGLPNRELLTSPRDPAMNETAPAVFKALFKTTKGEFVIETHREWAPNGADRFYNLVKSGYFDEVKFFRVVSGFMAQFGIHGDPDVSKWWSNATIQDDPVVKSNTRGYVTFAKTGMPHSRSTQLFINYVNRNANLDSQGFAPFGQVVSGMDTVDALFAEYGERTTSQQSAIYKQGNAFLDLNYPKLDSIITARLVD